MKHSITRKITFTMIGIVAGTIILCWLINTTMLENYYKMNKQDVLKNTYHKVNDMVKEENLYSVEAGEQIVKILENDNLSLLIINSELEVLSLTRMGQAKAFENLAKSIMLGQIDINWNEITDSYRLAQIRIKMEDADYIILYGLLDNGNWIFLRTPISSIRDSVWISNRFLSYIGIVAIIISAVISFFVTKRITNPILQLVNISKRMTNLEFDVKYQSEGGNEIDLLGEHMNQLSTQLEKTISELKSANNELKVDIEKKTEIDDMRKEFVSNVSHELKTPLALIQGYAEGLKECINEDADSREFYCDVIMDEADKMNQMVKKILSLNQLESGYESIVMERFNIVELIQGVIQSTVILREQNQITLHFSQEEPVYVWADEFKTEEVLVNYISNAIHHADGAKEITVSLIQKEKVVRISVFNTGTPIPEEDIDHIWTKFYKVDKARTREYGGSGIGLSIVKAIMDSFNRSCGAINHGDGVEFWFELDS